MTLCHASRQMSAQPSGYVITTGYVATRRRSLNGYTARGKDS